MGVNNPAFHQAEPDVGATGRGDAESRNDRRLATSFPGVGSTSF